MAYVRSGSQQPTGNAVAGDVKSGKIFSNENDVDLVGTFAAQEKTVTAGTSAASVTPDSGKYLSKVTYNPTPSQSKSIAPTTSAQTVRPDSGKLLSSVSVGAIDAYAIVLTPSTQKIIKTPESGRFFNKVTVGAIGTQEKTVTASRSNQIVTPDSHKFLTQVTVNKYPDASGTYTPSGADLNNVAADMTATNNLRYVNTAVCYNQGHSDGYSQGHYDGWFHNKFYGLQAWEGTATSHTFRFTNLPAYGAPRFFFVAMIQQTGGTFSGVAEGANCRIIGGGFDGDVFWEQHEARSEQTTGSGGMVMIAQQGITKGTVTGSSLDIILNPVNEITGIWRCWLWGNYTP